MRTVAVATFLALGLLVALVPPSLADDCVTSTSDARACTRVPVMKPAPPPPVPGIPAALNPYFDTYYVYLGPTQCTEPLSRACTGSPAAPGSGVPLPTGGAAPVGGVFGVVWQETDSCGNTLERNFLQGCGIDRMILV